MRDLWLLLKWSILALLLAVAVRWSFGLLSPAELPIPRGIVHDLPSVRTLETRQFPEHPWALLIGGSSINEAVNRRLLRRPSRKHAIIYGQAADVAFALDWTLRSAGESRRPEIVVWGVNPVCFMELPYYPIRASKVIQDRFNPQLFDRLGLHEAPAAAPEGERWRHAWAQHDRWFRQRAIFEELLENTLISWVDGGPTWPAGQPEVLSHFEAGDHEHRRKVIQGYRDLGLFQPDAYRPWHLRAIEFIIERCRQAGIPLLILGIPEHSELRAEYLPGAHEALLDRFRQLGADVEDWSKAIPDELFDDQIHQSEPGRAMFTQLLNEALDARVGRSPHRSDLPPTTE